MEHLYDDLDDSDSENVAPEREDYQPPLKVKKYSKVKNAAENTITTPESLKIPVVSTKTHVPIQNKPEKIKPVNKMMTTPESHHIPNRLPIDPRKLHNSKSEKHESPKNADLEIFTLTSENNILKNKLESIERELTDTKSRLERAEEGMLILIKHGNLEFNKNKIKINELKKEAAEKKKEPNDGEMASKIEIDKLKLELGVLKNKNASLQNQVITSKTTDRHGNDRYASDRHGNDRRGRDRNILNRRDYDRLQYDYDKIQDDRARSRDRNTRLVDDLRLQHELQVSALNDEVSEQKSLLKNAGKIFEKKKAKDQNKIQELEGWIESMAVKSSIIEKKNVKTETISTEILGDKIIDKTDKQSMTDKITVFNKFTETVPKMVVENKSTNTKFCVTTEIGSQTLTKPKLDTVVLDMVDITHCESLPKTENKMTQTCEFCADDADSDFEFTQSDLLKFIKPIQKKSRTKKSQNKPMNGVLKCLAELMQNEIDKIN